MPPSENHPDCARSFGRANDRAEVLRIFDRVERDDTPPSSLRGEFRRLTGEKLFQGEFGQASRDQTYPLGIRTRA